MGLSPASTFKIPHSLFGLDAGVLKDAGTMFPWDGVKRPIEVWNQDHTLASAMRYSVVPYYEELARRLGMLRESVYLGRIHYGNSAPWSGRAPASVDAGDLVYSPFWIGGSLRITPEQQLRFLDQFFAFELPFANEHIALVQQIMKQEKGSVQRGGTRVPFGVRTPDAVLYAKTGSNDTNDEHMGGNVRWLVGRVERGSRSWTFVSAVHSIRGELGNRAVDLAERRLTEAGVLNR